jgi:hypothetical protein
MPNSALLPRSDQVSLEASFVQDWSSSVVLAPMPQVVKPASSSGSVSPSRPMNSSNPQCTKLIEEKREINLTALAAVRFNRKTHEIPDPNWDSSVVITTPPAIESASSSVSVSPSGSVSSSRSASPLKLASSAADSHPQIIETPASRIAELEAALKEKTAECQQLAQSSANEIAGLNQKYADLSKLTDGLFTACNGLDHKWSNAQDEINRLRAQNNELQERLNHLESNVALKSNVVGTVSTKKSEFVKIHISQLWTVEQLPIAIEKFIADVPYYGPLRGTFKLCPQALKDLIIQIGLGSTFFNK